MVVSTTIAQFEHKQVPSCFDVTENIAMQWGDGDRPIAVRLYTRSIEYKMRERHQNQADQAHARKDTCDKIRLL